MVAATSRLPPIATGPSQSISTLRMTYSIPDKLWSDAQYCKSPKADFTTLLNNFRSLVSILQSFGFLTYDQNTTGGSRLSVLEGQTLTSSAVIEACNWSVTTYRNKALAFAWAERVAQECAWDASVKWDRGQ